MTYTLTIGKHALDGSVIGESVTVTAADHVAAYYEGARRIFRGPAPDYLCRSAGPYGVDITFNHYPSVARVSVAPEMTA